MIALQHTRNTLPYMCHKLQHWLHKNKKMKPCQKSALPKVCCVLSRLCKTTIQLTFEEKTNWRRWSWWQVQILYLPPTLSPSNNSERSAAAKFTVQNKYGADSGELSALPPPSSSSRYKFSKSCSLLIALYKINMELTFEKFLLCRHPHRRQDTNSQKSARCWISCAEQM